MSASGKGRGGSFRDLRERHLPFLFHSHETPASKSENTEESDEGMQAKDKPRGGALTGGE